MAYQLMGSIKDYCGDSRQRELLGIAVRMGNVREMKTGRIGPFLLAS